MYGDPSDTAAWRLAKIACGACCVADCRITKSFVQAMTAGTDPRHDQGGGFALAECSSPACQLGQMHAECYEVLEEKLQKAVGSSWANGSSSRKKDAKSRDQRTRPTTLWESKYDEVRSLCRCACGAGQFRALLPATSSRARRSAREPAAPWTCPASVYSPTHCQGHAKRHLLVSSMGARDGFEVRSRHALSGASASTST